MTDIGAVLLNPRMGDLHHVITSAIQGMQASWLVRMVQAVRRRRKDGIDKALTAASGW